MMSWKINLVAIIWAILTVVFWGLTDSALSATRESRPFWTEKSAFVEGEDLFVVGVGSKVKTAEEGRQKAFEHGRTELMNFAQITNLEAQGLVIETQMTYEEANADGTVTVFRLLRAPAKKLIEIQNRVQAQTRTQEQSLDQARRELAATQESVLRKQQELETRGKELETAVSTVSRLQVTLGEKALKIEQQQKQVEQLLRQLSMKFTSKVKPGASSPVSEPLVDSPGSLLKTLQETEVRLDAEAVQLSEIRQRAIDRMEKERERNQTRCQNLVLGMTQKEVIDIMGYPNFGAVLGEYRWGYGNLSELVLNFHSLGGLEKVMGGLERVTGCRGVKN